MLRLHSMIVAIYLFTGILTLTGCGGGGSGGESSSGTASATILLSAEGSTTRSVVSSSLRGAGGGPVAIEDIESLFVTVTEVTLQRCGGDDDNDDGSNLETVLVEDFEFDPTSVTIEEGGSVRWVWTTNTLHTITSGLIGDIDAGSEFDESADDAGAVVEIVFEDAGEYPYFSETETDISEAMTGIVNVVDDDGEDDGSGDGGHETVFEGAVDVNILDLTQLSEVLSTVEISAGDYCRIIIRITNPRLVLVADPGTVITNVHLTANGRLFIKDHFELEDGDEVLIIVNFGSIHLVEAGASGQYVLTPQLRADVDVQEAAVEIEGTIESIQEEGAIVTVRTEGDELYEVFADSETVIHTDDDSDDPSELRGEDSTDVLLTFADLEVGQVVEVEGLLTVGGQIVADDIDVDDNSIDTIEPEADPV